MNDDEELKNEHQIREASEEPKPVPWRAGLYSAVFPGLGQMYSGDYGRGSFYFVLAFILIVAFYLVIPIFFFIAFWLYNIYQAYSYAKTFHNE